MQKGLRGNMKKKWIVVLLLTAAVLALSACGKKEKGRFSYDLKDYVEKLGEYTGLEYNEEDTAVKDEEIEAEVKAFLSAYPERVEGRPVEEGDIVNIDFEGKKDGVAFEGGTSKGFDLTIGSKRFIPGFEDGLIGKKIGETVDLDLTFPKDYDNEELKGAKVVFTVKINHIQAPLKEITDALVSQKTEVKTVAAFKELINETIAERKKISLQTQLMEKVVKETVFKGLPKELETYYGDQFKLYYENIAKANQISLEDLITKQYKITQEEFDKRAGEYFKFMGEQRLVVESIAEGEKLSVSDKEYEEELEKLFKSSNPAPNTDKKAFEETVGADNIKNTVLTRKVVDLMIEKGKPVKK